MADVYSKRKRSAVMRRVKSKDSKAELTIRSLLHRMGYRFRLHRSDLPGKPDIVLPRHRKVIFVHGCFWHGHTCTRGKRVPKTNTDYWLQKIDGNRKRDAGVKQELEQLGWTVLVVWECELNEMDTLKEKLLSILC